MSFSFTSLQVNPSREQLTSAVDVPAPLDPFTELPSDLPTEIALLAESVTADATTPIDQALALQDWFREDGGFRYSTEREAGGGLETIREFLTIDKFGYCEQFAASMALMARSLGIPARVAVGFLRPEPVEGGYAYSGTDMHAWPELYFDGIGWLRFEPTPAFRTGDAPTYTGGPDESTTPTVSASTTPSGAPTTELRTPLGPQGAAGAAGGDDGGDSTWSTVLTVCLGLLAVLGLAVAPRFARATVRRRRWARAAAGHDAAEPAWQELRDSTVDLGLGFDDRATLRTAGHGLRTHLGGQQQAIDALNRLVVRVERARFARAGSGSGAAADVQQARADVDTVLAGLAAGRNRRRLLRATWLPVSLVRRVRGDSAGTGVGRTRRDGAGRSGRAGRGHRHPLSRRVRPGRRQRRLSRPGSETVVAATTPALLHPVHERAVSGGLRRARRGPARLGGPARR